MLPQPGKLPATRPLFTFLDEWEKGGRKMFVKECPTNAMLEEYHNLETKMKHANAHNAERLYHYTKKQSEYVEGFKVDLDMYCKPSETPLPKAFYLLTKEEEIDLNNFRQSVLRKANKVALVYDYQISLSKKLMVHTPKCYALFTTFHGENISQTNRCMVTFHGYPQL